VHSAKALTRRLFRHHDSPAAALCSRPTLPHIAARSRSRLRPSTDGRERSARVDPINQPRAPVSRAQRGEPRGTSAASDPVTRPERATSGVSLAPSGTQWSEGRSEHRPERRNRPTHPLAANRTPGTVSGRSDATAASRTPGTVGAERREARPEGAPRCERGGTTREHAEGGSGERGEPLWGGSERGRRFGDPRRR